MSAPCFGAAGTPNRWELTLPLTLPGEGTSRPWADSHPSLVFWQEVAMLGLYLWECWPAPYLLCHPSTQHVSSRDRESPFGARPGSVQGLCDHTLFIFLVSVHRDLLVT